MSFGRPTYGRLGRQDVNPSSDDAVPQAKPVDGLDGLPVAGMAAGKPSLAILTMLWLHILLLTALAMGASCTACKRKPSATCGGMLMALACVNTDANYAWPKLLCILVS